MNNYQFYKVLLDNFNLYIYTVIGCLLLYILVFHKTVKSIIDPILMPLMFSSLGFSAVTLLYFTNNITNQTYFNYVFTQIAFFIGFFCFKLKKAKTIKLEIKNFESYTTQVKACFTFFFIVLFFSQCYAYSQRGIPLFQASRLEFYEGGSGFGFFSRIMEITTSATLYFFMILFFNRKQMKLTWIYYFMGSFNFLFLFFTGSKSALLVIPFTLFCYINYNNTNFEFKNQNWFKTLKKYALPFVIVSVVLAIFIIAIQKRKEEITTNPYLELVIRFVHAGDVYWYAYPNDHCLKLYNEHWFQALFCDFLGLFRIYNWDDMPKAIGINLIQYYHPGKGTYGPNARHNVFGLVYFGYYFSILFSFCLGLILSFIRNKLVNFNFNQFIGGFIYTFLYVNGVSSIEADPMLFFGHITNLAVVFPLLFIIFLIFYQVFYKTKIKAPQLIAN